jgi:hypothetical protein
MLSSVTVVLICEHGLQCAETLIIRVDKRLDIVSILLHCVDHSVMHIVYWST